jgi:hypothetical protein
MEARKPPNAFKQLLRKGRSHCVVPSLVKTEVSAKGSPGDVKSSRRWKAKGGKARLMKAVAIKKDQTRDKAPANFQSMGTLRCEVCGEDFVICQSPAFVDKSVADRQAHWLEKVLAEEHERDKKHDDWIELPE